MRKKYTHLFFDLDNTLWDFKTNSKCAMQETFNILQLDKKGVAFDAFFDIYSRHNTNLWTAYRKKEVSKKELTRQRFQLTFDSLAINGVDALAMNELYLYEMPKQSHLIEGAKEILDYAKSKVYRLFIITNGFKEVQHAKLKRSGLDTYFEKVFISEEIKMPKPGREIFEHAIKSANAKKKSSVMIGDDWDVDICGATNFGIDAIYYNHLKQPVPELKNTVQVIHSLSGLSSIL
ncbi:YjjG family noncanonical pyrimidine nucleotidase [uncultured Draconibacterium sp.]|uniref:YjjG family noncanonical pyrimidine nucleotidase n=1 Tax=uncultured Draconibacterium sp. TaxID=1573823 RepID=UPI002AA94862|nr:YjjG family noncanonical pyrimidine nucleotidase [uncultured Draconibacterium sp.]